MKSGHNYANLAQSHILFYKHQQPMVPDHATEYGKSPSIYHGRMHEDGLTDRLMNLQSD